MMLCFIIGDLFLLMTTQLDVLTGQDNLIFYFYFLKITLF